MATIIHIETSTQVCSVALSSNGVVLFAKEEASGMNHATHLAPFIQAALEFAKSEGLDIDAMAVSCGPGSYTGLRIGVSTAKGFCYGRSIPLIAINTLDVMVESLVLTYEGDLTGAILAPMLDARRMEVYTAHYNSNLERLGDIKAEIIEAGSYAELLSGSKMIFFGNGALKCMDMFESENAIYISDIDPNAKYMVRLAEKAFENGEFVDVAYFEPFYLKEFVGTTPKNRVLGQ
ncbi:MAG: tRNA (adenosine(37)-N6)-threonylcarbamoyltransferase complex dimerization subunit type 1 TsaB [Bacteroidales bacterium]